MKTIQTTIKNVALKVRFNQLNTTSGLFLLCLLLVSLAISNMQALSQCPPEELVSGLREPTGTALTNQGNLLVSENGTTELHSGRISIVDPTNGNRRTLLDGLPSALSDVNEPSGPHGIVMWGRTLYVTIGVGDVGIAGPIAGTTIPNTNPISSPIFSSVLAIHFSANVEKSTTGFTLTIANQQALANGQTVTLSKGGGDKITIQLVANFPDYIQFPLPFFPDNIQLSNPFQMVLEANKLYVTDGGRNLVWKVDINSGSYNELALFPNIPNPVFPTFGGPFLEAVPTGIAYSNSKLNVTLFRGFPFPPGVSTIQQIDPLTGDNNVFITGLRSVIGVIPLNENTNNDYLVLQHNSGGTILPPFTGSGLLLHFGAPNDPPTLMADCLTRPTTMLLDKKSGKLYVSEHAGRIVTLNIAAAFNKSIALSGTEPTGFSPDDYTLNQNFPNPFYSTTRISWNTMEPGTQTLKVYDMTGREIATLVDEYRPAGSYEVKFDASHLLEGAYFYRLQAGEFTETRKLILMK